MVVFVCNNCNDSLKKPQVELHLSRSRCQGCSVSCLDCHRDFDRQSVKHHIKCVTEEERYSGGNFKPKVSTVNGERKRNEWMELVQRVASQKDPSRPPQVQQILKVCAGMQSVPAKQRAFENFIHNSQKPYINYAESAWNILQKEREATIVVNSPSKPAEKQDQSAEVTEVDASGKKKKGKENEEKTENLESQGDTEEGKKKKKRKLLEDIKPDLEGAEVNSNKKKKKKKSLVSLELDDESTPDAEEMVAESKKKKKKSVVSGEEGTSEVVEIPVESKKKKKQSVASAEESTPVEEVAVDSKKKKKKSMVSAEPDIEVITVDSDKKKKKSMVSVEESTPEVAEIAVDSKKKKKKSMVSAEPDIEEVAVDSDKKKKESMVSAEPDIEEIAVDSDKKEKSDGVEQEKLKQPLSKKQLKKQKKQEMFEQQLAIIELDAGNDMEIEDETVGKKDKKSKKKKGTMNGNHEEKLQNGNSEDHKIQSKKSKKRKADVMNGDGVDFEKKSRLNETLEETEAVVSNGGKFQWKATIEDVLRSAKHNRLPLKKVRRKVLHAYADQGGDPRDKSKSQDSLETKFSKMLAKMPNVKVENDKLELLLNTPSGD